MRGAGRVPARLALALLLCVAAATDNNDTTIQQDDSRVMMVSAVSFDEAPDSGAALAELLRGTLAARGVAARAVAPPAACAAPDSRACLRAVLAALAGGALAAALVPGARAPPPPELRDAGLDELADAAPPAHRLCYATPPPAAAPPRALLDLEDPAIASLYSLARDDLENVLRELGLDARLEYDCDEGEGPLATVVTGAGDEAALMARVLRAHGVRACVAAVGPGAAARVAAALAPRAAVVCGRALPAVELARVTAQPLAAPPCLADDCPFEARRLLKLVNVRTLAGAPSAIRALGRVALEADEARALAGGAAAARALLAAHPQWTRAAPEVRVAVMVPVSSRRETVDASAVRAAAELAEEDEATGGERTFRFKVEAWDDACSGARAFKHLTDALGTEFGALAAVAGPACAAAFGDVLRQSGALTLPVLAYTAQAPPAGAAWLALLAAGDARAAPAAWAALLAHMRWRRVAVLSEAGARPAELGADVVAHLELPDAGDRLDRALIGRWAERVRAVDGRIIFVDVEDACAVRVALCAGHAAGLRPEAGCVWVLPGALPAGWLAPTRDEACSGAELRAMAEGHLSAAWRWAARWAGAAGGAWAARWGRRCARARGAECGAPPPAAAALYDALRLWAAALARLDPAALEDLHREDVQRSLVKDAIGTPYVGVTGPFRWTEAGGAAARDDVLELRQWRNGSAQRVGIWSGGALAELAGLRWLTVDGRVPHDGGPQCALEPLAAALGTGCPAAHALAGALVAGALAALAAGGACQWRRRVARARRHRLAAARAPKAAVLDRWELPRERVVIDRKLGTGAFGTVYGGHALLAEGHAWNAVAVKTLRAGASADEKLDFLAEAEAMKRFSHENVVRLLGVVTATEPVCAVMEFMLYGDLKSYLVARRQLAGARGAAGAEVAPARLTALARGAARALAYLARLRYVHRDVAARNCLLSAQRVLKLADFGMARLVHEHDYYRFRRKGMLPVRWMAPESLTLGVFSPASDVWSFGVLLYEIATFGALPFQGLSNAEVLARGKAGRTLELPRALKPQLAALVRACWAREAAARPSAATLAAALAESPRLVAPCVDAPLDALPLALEPAAHAEARWISWGAPASAATDSTYLSADAAPRDTDTFLPQPPP